MSEPGLNLHDWETRWHDLETDFETDAGGTLPEAADLLEEVLGAERDADLDNLHASVRSARAVADRIERGDDVDPGDIGQAVEDLRAVHRALAAGDVS
jgi:hypothetical protein